MRDPRSIRVLPPDPYLFKSRLKRLAMDLFDRIGGLLVQTDTRPIAWKDVRRVAVLRLDHIGDVLMEFSFLTSLTRSLHKVHVDIWVGPWAKDTALLFGKGLGVREFTAPWFDRSGDRGSTWKGIRELEKALRIGGYDVVIDLRGDLRNIWAMKRSGIPVRAGQTRAGGDFWLTHPVESPPGLHESDRNLDLLRRIGVSVPARRRMPKFFILPASVAQAKTALERLGIRGPFIVLHATCLASAKQWPAENWRGLVGSLPKGMELVVVGSRSEESAARRIFQGAGRKVHFLFGELSLPALAAFLKKARLFIGVDSAPAHLAAGVGVPVVSLFSGTNLKGQWAPKGPRVRVIQKTPACSPCELAVCPLGHECMKGISVDEVLAEVRLSLGKGRGS